MTDPRSLADKETPHRIAYFMKAGKQLVPETPQVPSPEVQEMRLSLIEEEVTELQDAYAAGDIPEIVDAGIDLAIVALGAALDAAPAQAVLLCLKAVLSANEAKVDPKTGELTLREDGKILKPEGWESPDIAAILRLYSDETSSDETIQGLSAAREAMGHDS